MTDICARVGLKGPKNRTLPTPDLHLRIGYSRSVLSRGETVEKMPSRDTSVIGPKSPL
jgi:hypothetical protein